MRYEEIMQLPSLEKDEYIKANLHEFKFKFLIKKTDLLNELTNFNHVYQIQAYFNNKFIKHLKITPEFVEQLKNTAFVFALNRDKIGVQNG